MAPPVRRSAPYRGYGHPDGTLAAGGSDERCRRTGEAVSSRRPAVSTLGRHRRIGPEPEDRRADGWREKPHGRQQIRADERNGRSDVTMTVPLTYLEFHALFVLPPVVALFVAAMRRERAWWNRRAVAGIGIMSTLAVVYTTPWDNALIDRGVWWYGDGAVALTLWHAPLEEYLFFVFQPALTALWLYQFVSVESVPLRLPVRTRLVGLAAGLLVTVVGAALVLASSSTLYLGATLLWAGPVLAIQWAFGWPYLWRTRRVVAAGVLVPTLYLWIVDWIAIDLGIWVISSTYTTGFTLAGLPVEEAVFFLVTNVFVVQGLVLYRWLLDRLERSDARTVVTEAGSPTLADLLERREPER
ncbi:lycopene cyclase domain-containing protein [Natribaculum luteum]|uniref:Lycopene cyclase domain-containing protein n=1 Tax=Natribaculum luteum TaxID=1586232 RepID=A0ABD5NTN7_9EURY|nr:lycopene cyclase domain-containing protein [Natribaculum luteum]